MMDSTRLPVTRPRRSSYHCAEFCSQRMKWGMFSTSGLISMRAKIYTLPNSQASHDRYGGRGHMKRNAMRARMVPKTDFLGAVGELLFQLREERGLSMKQVADKCGISVSYYCDLENGQNAASFWLMTRLALALDVEISALTPREEAACLEPPVPAANAPKSASIMKSSGKARRK
ncbi:MAG: XRE family transcriptional regulator [Desulfurellales bacterium]|nr:MAG: XRE family transcriptional regulator [Desulfurellales bacterium]